MYVKAKYFRSMGPSKKLSNKNLGPFTIIAQPGVGQSEVFGQFYNQNTTPKDKERVVVCLCGTGQELH